MHRQQGSNVQHGRRRARPWSYRVPMILIVVELAALVAIVIVAGPTVMAYLGR